MLYKILSDFIYYKNIILLFCKNHYFCINQNIIDYKRIHISSEVNSFL